jgi:hypothetical protein
MRWLRSYPCGRRLAALAQLVAFLAACTSWRVEPVAPADLVATKPYLVRLTVADSSHLTLIEPVIRYDTLYGFRQDSDQSRAKVPEAIPLNRVKQVEVRRPDPTKTTLFGVGVLVAAFTALCLADSFVCASDESFLTGAAR